MMVEVHNEILRVLNELFAVSIPEFEQFSHKFIVITCKIPSFLHIWNKLLISPSKWAFDQLIHIFHEI